MSELLTLLATSLAFLVEPGRFRIVDSKSFKGFGDALITLESEQARVLLSRDRSQIFLELQPLVGTDEWFSIDLLQRALGERKRGGGLLNKAAIKFLDRRLAEIESRFSAEDTRNELLRSLSAARAERSRKMWGR